MQNHQGQDVEKTGFSRVRDVQAKNVQVQEQPTIIIPCSTEKLQDHDQCGRNYVGIREN